MMIGKQAAPCSIVKTWYLTAQVELYRHRNRGGLGAKDATTTAVYDMLYYIHNKLFMLIKTIAGTCVPVIQLLLLIVQDYYLFISPPK